MAEENESVREDSSNRQIPKGLQIEDMSGKRLILPIAPNAIGLPTNPRRGEVVLHEESVGNWKLKVYNGSSWLLMN